MTSDFSLLTSPAGEPDAAPAGLSSPHIWPLREVSAEHDVNADVFDPWEAHRDAHLEGVYRPDWKLRNWRGRDLGRQTPRITYYENGNLVSFRHPPVRGPKVRGDRGAVSRFSASSRLRLLRKMNRIDRTAVSPASIWMVTLTYPGRWTPDPAVWKRDLQTYRKRLQRHWGKLGCYWKLEPQVRGAPHFHLLLFTTEDMHQGMELRGYRMNQGRRISRWRGGKIGQFIGWAKDAWADVVGSTDPKHRAAGTSVEPLESFQGAVSYAGKYLGKSCSFINPETGEELRVGRFWGEWNRELIPQAKPVSVNLLWEHWTRIRRGLRNWAEAERRRKGTKHTTRGLIKRVNAMNGITRSCQTFVPGHVARRLVEHYAGAEAFLSSPRGDRHQCPGGPGTFYEWVGRQIRENTAREALPPDPETRLGWFLGELQGPLWSDRHDGSDQPADN